MIAPVDCIKDFKILGHLYWATKLFLRIITSFTNPKSKKIIAVPADAYPDIKIYQAYYNPKTQKHLDPQFIPFESKSCTKYFADQVILDIYDSGFMNNAHYFGVVSWRIWEKIICREDIRAFIAATAHENYDFYYFSGRILKTKKTRLWQQANFWHRSDLTTYTEKMIRELGFDCTLTDLQTVPGYYSYQICRTPLYRDYVENFLKPIKSKMDDLSDIQLQQWVNQDANYARYGDTVQVEELRKITGYPFYTKHAFITERLFPTYATLKGWRGKAID